MPSIDRRVLLTGVGAGMGLLASGSQAAHRAALHVTDLRTAGLRDPLAVSDAQPMLAWRIAGPDGTMQAAYHIRVARDPALLCEADLWDSKRVADATSTGIRYDGKPLKPRQTCWWQVRIWDSTGTVSAWSAPARWEMALAADDWRGDWLAVESAEDRADRSAAPRWHRARLADGAKSARFRLRFDSAAGEASLAIHTRGLLVALTIDGRTVPVPTWHKDAYGAPPAARIPLPLAKASHTLVAEIMPQRDGGDTSASLAAQLRAPSATGSVDRIIDGWEIETAEGGWRPVSSEPKQEAFAWPPTPARLLRRRFTLPAMPGSVRLHVAALGGYRVWINGKRVGDDELQSEPAEYQRHIPYRTHDIAALLRAGENVVAMMVGDGFYASYQAPDGRYAYGPAPRRFRLMIEDGAGQPIVDSDDRWRHRAAPITLSEIYAGEDHDRRQWPARWNMPDFDDSDWTRAWTAPSPAVALAAPLGPPIRVTRSLRPVAIRRTGATTHIVDFGQNFAGRVRLSVSGASGDLVVVRHAEILTADGALDRRNLRVARAEDRYVLAGGGTEVLEPVFTFQGFRYAQIDGIADLTAAMVTGLVVSSDLDEIGIFTTAQPLVQKLWLNTLWSQRSNFRGNPTDCPQRDERLGWTGDAQVFWDTAAFNMDVGGFTRAFTRMLRDDQAENGAYPMWSPSPKGLGWGSKTATPGWADAGVMLPYVAFLHGGDRAVVDDNWAAMANYCEGILAQNPDGLWRNGRGADLGDWLALDAKQPSDETTPKPLIGSAMLARALDQMAAMATWTGRGDAGAWQAKAARTRRAFAAAYVAADGTVGNGSHTSYVLALRLDLVPQAVQALSAQRLAADIVRRGTLLTTGFLGTPLALDALVDAGHGKLAFDLLLRTDFPSWGYMAKQGATTIWERWNGDTGDVSMNSFNHYALGAVCSFLYRRVAGVEPIAPGFRRFRVAPLFDPRFASAGVTLDSASGRIETVWNRTKGQTTVDLTVPANTVAEVILPGVHGTYRAGRHRFTVVA